MWSGRLVNNENDVLPDLFSRRVGAPDDLVEGSLARSRIRVCVCVGIGVGIGVFVRSNTQAGATLCVAAQPGADRLHSCGPVSGRH